MTDTLKAVYIYIHSMYDIVDLLDMSFVSIEIGIGGLYLHELQVVYTHCYYDPMLSHCWTKVLIPSKWIPRTENDLAANESVDRDELKGRTSVALNRKDVLV